MGDVTPVDKSSLETINLGVMPKINSERSYCLCDKSSSNTMNCSVGAVSPVGLGAIRSESHDSGQSISKILDIAKKCNSFFLNKLSSDVASNFKPFIIDGHQVGILLPEVTRQLINYRDVFVFRDDSVQFSPHLNTYDSRSQAMAKVLLDLKEKETFLTLKGWRNECYEVATDISQPSFLKIERSASCLFGFRQYGVDINGYVNHPTKGLCLWFQRRAKTKARWGGKLDNMVGGGLSVGFGILETAHKEAREEASIPDSILKNLVPARAVSIFYESERGLSPNTEFVYDLELPLDFIPENEDGEVDSFHLLTAAEALKVILCPEFKTTSCPVALDFLLRHGFINTRNESDLLILQDLLHIPLNLIYRKLNYGTAD